MVFTPDGTFPILNCEKGMVHVTFSGKADFAGGNGFKLTSVKGGNVINAIPAKAICKCEGITAEELTAAFDKLGVDCSLEINSTENGVDFTVHGKSAHGSRPDRGLNAITALMALLASLGCDKAKEFAVLFPHGEYNGKSAGLGFADKVSGDMSCALTLFDYDNGVVSGGIDIRFPIDKTYKEISDIIVASLKSACMEISTLEGMEPHYVPEDSDFVQALLEVYETVKGEKGYCIAEGGITYVHNTEGGVAFGAEFPDESNNMHGADEHISIETFKYNLNMYANAIIKICGE